MGRLASALRGEQPWYLEAHQFRIDTTDGIGRPTPEGAHRDGVDLVAVVLVGREGIKGGETRVFDSDGPTGMRFTMQAPWTCLLLDDARVIHESTPIQPLEAYGHRDTLVLTLRAGGFQGAELAGRRRHAHALRLREHLPRGARRDSKDLRAQWALEEIGLPYRVHALDHAGGELDGDAYSRSAPSARCRSSTTTASWWPSRPPWCSTWPRRPAS